MGEGLVTVRRLCKSDAHEEPRDFTHRREILTEGRVRYTCAICGETTIEIRLLPMPALPEAVDVPVKLRSKCTRGKLTFTDQQLIDLHAEELYDREIAETLGVTRRTVCHRRRKLGLQAHGSRQLFTDEQLKELYEQGFNDREMGEVLGASYRTVGGRRRKLGLKAIGRRR